jgi:DNA repair protein RadC
MEQLDLFGAPARKKRRSKPKSACEWRIVAVRECVAPYGKPKCDTPQSAADYWRAHIATSPYFNPEVESLVVLLLNTKYRVRGHHVVSIGSLNESIAHPREMFRAAIIGAAYCIVLLHNHPSGDPSPSQADMRLTRRIVEAGDLLQIKVLDHVIVGHQQHYSLREAGLV